MPGQNLGRSGLVQRLTHVPFWHAWFAAQALPQAPQFVVVFNGVQTPLQQPSPVAHA